MIKVVERGRLRDLLARMRGGANPRSGTAASQPPDMSADDNTGEPASAGPDQPLRQDSVTLAPHRRFGGLADRGNPEAARRVLRHLRQRGCAAEHRPAEGGPEAALEERVRRLEAELKSLCDIALHPVPETSSARPAEAGFAGIAQRAGAAKRGH